MPCRQAAPPRTPVKDIPEWRDDAFIVVLGIGGAIAIGGAVLVLVGTAISNPFLATPGAILLIVGGVTMLVGGVLAGVGTAVRPKDEVEPEPEPMPDPEPPLYGGIRMD